jgi:hypothetical protein
MDEVPEDDYVICSGCVEPLAPASTRGGVSAPRRGVFTSNPTFQSIARD